MQIERVVSTSPRTDAYNCVAWAIGVQDAWWWPDRMFLAYWPDGIPREETIDAFVQVFRSVGFDVPAVHDVDAPYERVAIFSHDGQRPTHIARRINGDRWASKLGRAEDVEHSLVDLEGDRYGRVHLVLERRIST